MKKLAIIGMGNMGTALATGFLGAGVLQGADIAAFDVDAAKLQTTTKKLGITAASSAADAVLSAEMTLMACKPQHVAGAVAEIGAALSGRALLSIALGWDKARYAAILPADTRVQFVMPNTPAMVGEGMFLFESDTSFTESELQTAHAYMAALGEVVTLPSDLMGIGGAVSGCGPAFVDLLLEAFADAGVYYGLPRAVAQKLITQTVLGSAALQKETGTDPAVLKNAVCSPAGSTIRGVAALEENGFRAACIAAIRAIMEK